MNITSLLPGAVSIPDRWSWEIRRKSKPLGIKMTGDGYQSDAAAQIAAKRALADFLSDLSKRRKGQANKAASIGSLYPALAVAPLASRRIDLAARLCGLLYSRKSSSLARRAFALNRLR